METMKTYVALILDSSGSMEVVKDKTRNDFNEQLQTLKTESNSPEIEAKKVLLASDPANVSMGIETRVSVVTFNDKVNYVDFDIDINKISEITTEEYIPNGGTALYDAIGLTIDKFVDHYDLTDKNTGVLFVILTDGEENSSKTYKGESGRNTLKSRIDELNKSGRWTFTFMGTENALEHVEDFAFNKIAYAQTVSGMEDMKQAHIHATKHYFNARSMGATSVSNFYGNEEEEEK